MGKLLTVLLFLGIQHGYSQEIITYKSYKGSVRGDITKWKWKNTKTKKSHININFYLNDNEDELTMIDSVQINNSFNDLFIPTCKMEITDNNTYLLRTKDRENQGVEIEIVDLELKKLVGSVIKQRRMYIRYNNIEYYYIFN